MDIVRKKLTLDELRKVSEKMYHKLVKAVVDLEQNIMVIDMEMHADGEKFLLEEQDSQQEYLWGINLHPDLPSDKFVEFDSMINIRPSQGNRSRGVEDKATQEKIKQVVSRWVEL